jgi:hypothetical protein
MCALQPTNLNLLQLQKTPNNWKYPKDKNTGTYCQTYGDMLPIQNIWGQIADTKEYLWNIIDYNAWHESRSILNFRQQPRQPCIQQGHVPKYSFDC